MQLRGSDIEKAYQVDYWNGFGFQYQPEFKCFYIAKVRDDFKIPHQYNKPNICWLTDYLGYNFLTVAFDMYEEIPNIFNAVLNSGESFTTHTRPAVRFTPQDKLEFNRTNFELLMVKQQKEICADYCKNNWEIYFQLNSLAESLLRHWNWATTEGRLCCTILRDELHLCATCPDNPRMQWPWYDKVTRENEILHQGGWGKYDPDLLNNNNNNVESPQKKTKKEEEEDKEQENQECIICMDKNANTLVLPCMHCVVCLECSKELENTNDSKTCVQCRRPIDEVLGDDN